MKSGCGGPWHILSEGCFLRVVVPMVSLYFASVSAVRNATLNDMLAVVGGV